MVKVVLPIIAALMLVPSAWAQTIGVSVCELAADEVSRAKLERPGGVYVVDVREGSPASRAGVRSGDIIVIFDGERVRGVRHFSRLVAETPSGRAVPAEVARDGGRQAMTVTPEGSDRLAGMVPDIRREIERGLRTLPLDLPMAPPLRGARARLGVTLIPLTDQLASYFGVKDGALVSAVEADSPAARAGLRAGDVLTEVDGRPVRDPADVTAAIRAAARGATLDIRLVREKKEMGVKVTIRNDQPATRRTIPI